MNAVLSSTLPPHAALLALRERAPLVQCVTNAVVTNFTANVLLALGAAPAMSDLPGEAGVFAGVADGSLVNLGTPTPVQADGAREVVAATRRWVLDPVAVGALPVRTALAHELLDARPAIIRGNASEILALAGSGAGGRGVDSVDGPDAARAAAIHLALSTGSVVAVSGEVDLVTGGREIVRVPGGDVLLTKVTGGGCALGATMAAFLGVADALSAAVSASLVHAVAAERAAARATGPGSFATAFLDELAALEPHDLERAEPRLVRTPADVPAQIAGEVTR